MPLHDEKHDFSAEKKYSLPSDGEAEVITAHSNPPEYGLKRQMKNRHIAMIRYLVSYREESLR